MDIVNYVNIAHLQNGRLWWKIDIKTNEHSCSELLSKICGIKQSPFTMENFMLMLHSDFRNKLLRQISTSLKIGSSGERFSFLTKFVYHGTHNIPDLLDDNSLEGQITSGLTDFTTDHNVCATQNTEDQTKSDRQVVMLVAEDTDSNFLLITRILKHQYKLARTLNDAQAVELYKTDRPNLILMDMKMPIMGGLEATQKIREMTGIFPFIMLTAFVYDDNRNEAIRAGCSFMIKPLQANKFKRENIAQHLIK